MDQNEPLLEYALKEIRNGIQNGTYPPGTKLVTQKIAASLGISSTPVVAAINRLVTQGLLETIPRKGAIVKSFTAQDIKNYLEMRLMMETYAVDYAIQNVDFCPEIIQEMESIAEDFQTVYKTDFNAVMELELRFHSLFVSLVGNKQLNNLYEFNWSIGSIYHMHNLQNIPLQNLSTSFYEHKLIVEYLKAKDRVHLLDLVRSHLKFLMETLDWFIKNGKRFY